MARRRRQIVSGRVYEICLRARAGLPFPPNTLINLLIKSALARVQRDHKLTICHLKWMTNHLHGIVVVRDSEQAIKFVMELKKKLTDILKRLLGIDHLLLWETHSMMAEILDIDTALSRIAYIYANAAISDLVDTIQGYPGVSSWGALSQAESTLDATHVEIVPWIRLPAIAPLPSRSLTKRQCQFFTKKLSDSSTKSYSLTFQPNAWMKCFGIEEESEIASYNDSAKERTASLEKEARDRRAEKDKIPLGKERLEAQPIMQPHKPKKKSRAIFVLSSNTDLRISFISAFKETCTRLLEIYQEWKIGNFSSAWPPGFFRPPMPPLANAI